MKMRAIELRIGNIVTVDNPKYHPQLKGVLLRVTGIQEKVISNNIEHCLNLELTNKKANSYYQTYSQFIEYIKPIELTEQWLLDLGFEKEHVDFRTQYNPAAYIGSVLRLNEFTVYLNKPEIEWSYRVTVIIAPKYLHQLQNLFFALTNCELKVKL